MQIDEAGHATTAMAHGGEELPAPVKLVMKLGSKVMTQNRLLGLTIGTILVISTSSRFQVVRQFRRFSQHYRG